MSVTHFLTAFIFPLLLSAPSSQWTVTKLKKKNGEGYISQLEFKKGRQKSLYTPERKSLWVIDVTEMNAGKRTYFVTTWSYGGQSLLYRIFDPNVKISPLCEIISYGEKTQLRVSKGYLQMRTDPDTNLDKKSSPQWKNCRKL